MAGKPIVAVDVDDVLSLSAASWIAYSNERWGSGLNIEDYDEDWAKMWQVDHEEGVRRAYQIHEAVGLVRSFAPDKQAYAILQQLSQEYDLVVTTSRVQKHRQETLDWLDEHFDGIFTNVHLAGFYDTVTHGSFTATKADLVAAVGAAYLIDDQPKHCLAVAASGRQAILFGDYSWTRLNELPKNVTRCKDWAAVKEYFDGKTS